MRHLPASETSSDRKETPMLRFAGILAAVLMSTALVANGASAQQIKANKPGMSMIGKGLVLRQGERCMHFRLQQERRLYGQSRLHRLEGEIVERRPVAGQFNRPSVFEPACRRSAMAAKGCAGRWLDRWQLVVKANASFTRGWSG